MTLSENTVEETVEITETTTEDVDLTTVSVETFRDYKLRTLVDSFSKGWGSKQGKALEKKLKTKKGLYIWQKKSDIPAQVDPGEWFVDNLKEKDPKKGSLIRAYYIGSGDVVGRGWATPADKHAFGAWLKSENNVENLNKSDFQYFYLSIADQAVYENLENALQEWNKQNREDKLPFEISETSSSGGSQGSRVRMILRALPLLTIDECSVIQDGLLSQVNQLWVMPETRKNITSNQS